MVNIKNLASCVFILSLGGSALAEDNVTATTNPVIPAVTTTSAEKFSPEQVKAIENIVHDYLVGNPEVLIEASNALRVKMEQDQETKALTAIEKNKAALFDNHDTPFIGNPQGNEIIVEFFDYQCPHCKEMNEPVKNLIEKNPNLKIIFRDWPIFGGASLSGAKAAIAAKNQGKYFAMHEALLTSSNPLTDDKIYTIASSLGLDVKQLKKDMESDAVKEQIESTFSLAKSLELSGTPVFIVTNKNENKFRFVPGATTEEKLQKLLAEIEAPDNNEDGK